MLVEKIMFFGLGFLAAGLFGVALGSALWNRAVRLTRRRIEAATPVTLNEFRADKDRLRAEFAIALRKRETHIDALREKLTVQIVALDKAATELSALRAERDDQYAAIESFQERERELVARVRDLERDGAALAARLRQVDVDLSDFDPDLMPDTSEPVSADDLTGDYRADVEDLLAAISIERQRNSYLEEQARMLLARLEKKRKGAIKDEAIAMLRDTLSSDPASEARVELRRAEARIAGAESRLNALLSDTGEPSELPDPSQPRALAQDLSEAEQYEFLRSDVAALEEAANMDHQSAQFDAEALRARLQSIASDVSRIVYAADAEDSDDLTESLFDKVCKFAADGLGVEELALVGDAGRGPVSDRMAALRDMQAR